MGVRRRLLRLTADFEPPRHAEMSNEARSVVEWRDEEFSMALHRKGFTSGEARLDRPGPTDVVSGGPWVADDDRFESAAADRFAQVSPGDLYFG